MSITLAKIAIRNGQILVPPTRITVDDDRMGETLMGRRDVLTVLANLARDGYGVDRSGILALLILNKDELSEWWAVTNKALSEENFSDRGMDRFVVYKNFPAEVLSKSEADYWFPQIMMYMGSPPSMFAEQEEPRAPMDDDISVQVLKGRGPENFVEDTFASLREKGRSWTDPESGSADDLIRELAKRGGLSIEISDFKYRGNGVNLAQKILSDQDMRSSVTVKARNATDALRLAKVLAKERPVKRSDSYEPVSSDKTNAKRKPRSPSVIGTMSRPHRRLIARMLTDSASLEEDASRRPRDFLALMRSLRPGELGDERLSALYDSLYNGRVRGAQSAVENAIKAGADSALLEAESLPAGVRLRRFRKLYSIDPAGAVSMAVRAMPELDTAGVLAFASNVRAMNDLPFRVAVPKGEWRKLQVLPNDGPRIAREHQDVIAAASRDLIGSRLAAEFPQGVRRLDDFDRLDEVKVPDNGQAFAPYGRGTTFPVPDEDGFVRTASYWRDDGRVMNTWFDNGITLLNGDMSEADAVCWNNERTPGGVACFSGDPVNSQDNFGRACQMIDVYPEKRGDWRYALWSVLAFSSIRFSDVRGEVLATLQTGTDPQSGNLYEPSRARFAFRLERPVLTSYVAVFDMQERSLTYLDMDLGGDVHSAMSNRDMVMEKLPAVLAVLKSRPSWRDLMECAPESPNGTPVGYADHGVRSDRALTFSQEDETAVYEQVRITDLLSGKGGGYTVDHGIPDEGPSLI